MGFVYTLNVFCGSFSVIGFRLSPIAFVSGCLLFPVVRCLSSLVGILLPAVPLGVYYFGFRVPVFVVPLSVVVC